MESRCLTKLVAYMYGIIAPWCMILNWCMTMFVCIAFSNMWFFYARAYILQTCGPVVELLIDMRQFLLVLPVYLTLFREVKPHLQDCIHHQLHSYTWSYTCFQKLFFFFYFLRCSSICLAVVSPQRSISEICTIPSELSFHTPTPTPTPHFLEVFFVIMLCSWWTIWPINFCYNYMLSLLVCV